MKTGTLESHHEWLKCMPNELSNCFELPDSDLEPKRITGVTYQLNQEFINAIRNTEAKKLKLSLYMAISEGHFCPYFELENSTTKKFKLVVDHYHRDTLLSPTTDTFKGYLGVSANYKNEVCINWSILPYYKVEGVFFSRTAFDEQSKTPQLITQKRVRKFIIPGADLLAIKKVLDSASIVESISVHFGVSNSKVALNEIPFDPIIEIEMARSSGGKDQKTVQDEGDGDSSFFDFVHACPPFCGPD